MGSTLTKGISLKNHKKKALWLSNNFKNHLTHFHHLNQIEPFIKVDNLEISSCP